MRAAPLALAIALALGAPPARADEGGVSVYAPGMFSSLAAVPGAPGWSLSAFYYHSSADASVSESFRFGGRIVAGIDARADIVFVAPTYTFAQPVAGAQAAVGLMTGVGNAHVSADATLTGPLGHAIRFGDSDSFTGGIDLFALGTLKWKRDVHNFMAYGMIGAPVGAYRTDRLANVGTNHWSLDGGGGYTYFDEKGREFSMMAGLTYNFENPDTDYRNGVDSHVDWGASQFFSESLHAGIAGYFYYQLTGDSGPGAVLGPFKSRTNGVGPQLGWFFPFGGGKGYVNVRGYWEFDAAHRAEGWTTWVSLALPLGGAPK